MDWNVPIECDAEYGHSWDVDYNVTDKNFQRLTPYPGWESYVPSDFDMKTVKNLYQAFISGMMLERKAKNWITEILHSKVQQSVRLYLSLGSSKD